MVFRFTWCFVLLLATLAYCFTPDEIEIFQLQKELVDKYGSKMNFYKFLKLKNLDKATAKDITKQFRSLSKKYHPDKNRNNRKLYERLTLVAKILGNGEKRKTYDYYLKYGFPEYNFAKGGFVFKRSKLHAWIAVGFVYFACGIIHWVILKIQNNANKRRINGFLKEVKSYDDTLGLGEKRLSFKYSQDSEEKQIMVRYGDVFVVQPDGTEAEITVKDVKDPGLRDTMLFTLPMWFCRRLKGIFVRNDTLVVQEVEKKGGKKPSKAAVSVQVPNGRAKKD
ncbi:HHL092Wp [Eremothecium sinecaudum]|uniref:HHL092Wp n=1 Tax=Eremothecium sinecaudum TaxID=45286 RepID=A0A109V0A5_9SACH|nr:HHL092Wp [Eremothecium sinecaudum]AMD22678.1 HHL092Wp [Eremothecium sinecaudum]